MMNDQENAQGILYVMKRGNIVQLPLLARTRCRACLWPPASVGHHSWQTDSDAQITCLVLEVHLYVLVLVTSTLHNRVLLHQKEIEAFFKTALEIVINIHMASYPVSSGMIPDFTKPRNLQSFKN